MQIASFKVRQQLTRELYAKWGFQKIQVKLDRNEELYAVTKLKGVRSQVDALLTNLGGGAFNEAENNEEVDTCADED